MAGTGLPDKSLLLCRDLGMPSLAEASRAGVAPFSAMVFLRETEALYIGAVEGAWEDSALLRGKGNSRAGGIGRMLAWGTASSVAAVEDE